MQTRFFAWVYLVWAVAIAQESGQSRIEIDSPAESVEAYVAQPIAQTVTINNDSADWLTLTAVHSSNKGFELVSVRPEHATVAPHGSKEIVVTLLSRVLLGVHRAPFAFDFTTQGGNQLSVRGAIGVFVQTAFDEDRPEIDLGVVKQSQAVRKELTLKSSEIPRIALTRVLDAPKFLAAKILDGGKKISLATTPSAPWGISQGFIKVGTNSAVQPEVWIKYQVDVRGEVIPSQNPVNFSPDTVGAEQEETVRLVRANGKTLDVESISVSGVALRTRVDDCTPIVSDCKLLRLVLPSDAPSGIYTGYITAKFKSIANDLPIAFGGFRLASGQKLRSLSDNEGNKTSVAVTGSTPDDIGKAIERASSQAQPRLSPPGRGPLLKWSVAHGAGIYGFVVYRGDSESGPFWRTNKAIIRAEDDNELHEWRDTTAEPGKVYWYYIAVAQNDGHKRKLSDPQKVVAK